MKSVIKTVAAVLALTTPLASFSQPPQPLTRAEVKAELAAVAKAGYTPASWIGYYPENLQAAEAKVAAERADHATALASE
jgi:hypothetical protein